MAEFRALLISPYPALAEVAHTVADDYPELEVSIHEGDLSWGLAEALASLDASYDVVISRGGTAQMLTDELAIPVIEIEVSTADLLDALARHNPSAERCAVVGFSNALAAVRQIADFADFDLDVFEVAFEDELPLVLQDVVAGAYKVVLCDTFSEGACLAQGLDAHLLESGEQSVREALDQALFLCQQVRDTASKVRVLWQLVTNQPAKVALFSDAGKLVYNNLVEDKADLLGLMRDHLGGPDDQRLALRRGRRNYRVAKSVFHDGPRRYTSFSVLAGVAPTGDTLVGIVRQNRDEIDRAYHESTFHTVGAGEELAGAIFDASRSRHPIMLEGEVGSGKAQIAALLYLNSSWSSRPFVTIDCPLLTDRSWHHLMNSHNSPLYATGETIWLRSVEALDMERARELLGVIRRTGLTDRNHVIVSANRGAGGKAAEVVTLMEEYLYCHVLVVPPLRARATIRHAVSLYLSAEARRNGTVQPLVTDEAMEVLCHHNWPRNYLEFAQILQRVSATAEDGTVRAPNVVEALDREASKRAASLTGDADETGLDLLRPLRDIERDIVSMVVDKFDGNQTRAAETLGISRTTVWRIMRE